MGFFFVTGVGISLSDIAVVCFLLNIEQKTYDLMLLQVKNAILRSFFFNLVTRKSF